MAVGCPTDTSLTSISAFKTLRNEAIRAVSSTQKPLWPSASRLCRGLGAGRTSSSMPSATRCLPRRRCSGRSCPPVDEIDYRTLCRLSIYIYTHRTCLTPLLARKGHRSHPKHLSFLIEYELLGLFLAWRNPANFIFTTGTRAVQISCKTSTPAASSAVSSGCRFSSKIRKAFSTESPGMMQVRSRSESSLHMHIIHTYILYNMI